MRILITGADGALGRAVLAVLPPEASAVAFDARFTAPMPPHVQVIEGHARNPELVASALDAIDTVLHLAPLTVSVGDECSAVDEASRGTYALTTTALDAGVRRFVFGSSLALFDRLPARWEVSETWRPRPEPRIEHLRPWLAELSAREAVRGSDASAICLRFGLPVDEAAAASAPNDGRWVHLEDAVAGVRRSLELDLPGWSVFHITAAGPHAKVRRAAAGREPFGYQPRHDFAASRNASPPQEHAPSLSADAVLRSVAPMPSRPIRNVVIFGAGGPLAAAAAEDLSSTYTLRLTDLQSIEEIAVAGPNLNQNPGAPVPVPLGAPHECRIVDVTSPEQVMAACEGMDAIINCTVIRPELEGAFRVNTVGAYNVVRAAVAHGIRRIVHTGPQLAALHGGVDYSTDYDVAAEAPPRPGRHLYGHSKYLGQEICRVFADYYDLEIPVLLFCEFVTPEMEQPLPLNPFAVSWQDAARAIRRAVEVAHLPEPFEVLNVNADLPHGTFTNRKAKEILGWQPLNSLQHMWSSGD